jgi:hypothetical protein
MPSKDFKSILDEMERKVIGKWGNDAEAVMSEE